MKKVIVLLVVLLTLCGCEKKIKYDYPDSEIADMSGYQQLDSDTSQFYKLTISGFLSLIEEEKTFIVYFGYEECPWCNDLLPILNEVSIEKQLPIYYIDFMSEENKNDIDGLEKIKDLCSDFLEEDDQGQLKLYFPTVFYVREGKVIEIHQGTVSGHDASKSALTEKQKARLKYNLEKEFDNLFKE